VGKQDKFNLLHQLKQVVVSLVELEVEVYSEDNKIPHNNNQLNNLAPQVVSLEVVLLNQLKINLALLKQVVVSSAVLDKHSNLIK
jgi:hypothetical protein